LKKCGQIVARVQAIHGYPDKNLPTLIIYYNGDLKKQFIGEAAFARGDPTVAGTCHVVLSSVESNLT
jgi:hypothetical protein